MANVSKMQMKTNVGYIYEARMKTDAEAETICQNQKDRIFSDLWFL